MKNLFSKKLIAIMLVAIVAFVFVFKMYSEENAEKVKPVKKSYPPGVVFTFDDDYIEDWYNAEKLLRPLGWKATFFVTWYGSLTRDQKDKLRYLRDMGHDIAGHGYNHLNALKYSKEFGIPKYIEDDIIPLKAAMKKDGFDIHSFAYPDGARDAELDKELLKHFDIIRGTTYDEIPAAQQFCYYEGNRLVYGLGIDDDYKQFNIPYYKTLLDYAKAHDKIVIFYGHKTVENADEKLETPLSALEDLCKYAKEKGLKFYTIDDLSKL